MMQHALKKEAFVIISFSIKSVKGKKMQQLIMPAAQFQAGTPTVVSQSDIPIDLKRNYLKNIVFYCAQSTISSLLNRSTPMSQALAIWVMVAN